MKIAVCGILPVLGHFLSVSRKDDPNKIGFIGGKIDEGETPEEGLIREVLEETGLHVEIDTDYDPFVTEDNHGYTVYSYIIRLKDVPHEQICETETGIIRLVNRIQMIKGSPYGGYNEQAFNWFNL